jgi:hypothetical protein
MTTATLNIAKNLTVVTNNYAYNANLSNLIEEANKFNLVNLNGVTKTEKLNKYLDIMLSNGYIVLSENWNRVNTIADGVSDFSITLSK